MQVHIQVDIKFKSKKHDAAEMQTIFDKVKKQLSYSKYLKNGDIDVWVCEGGIKSYVRKDESWLMAKIKADIKKRYG
tara:strand:+ start:523 stop:753 length:231 start_codon:yes stop_codon:yes gene_type:complete